MQGSIRLTADASFYQSGGASMVKAGGKRQNGLLQAYLFLGPAMLLLLVFKIYPILIAFVGSFFSESFLRGETYFSGLDNYISLFTDPTFITTLKVTFIFNIITTPLQIFISLLLALSVRMPTRVNGAFRSIFMMPIAIALSSGCMIWNILLNPNQGVVNSLLMLFGIPAQPFFTSPTQSMMSVIIICIWKGCGYWMLYLLSGIQDVSESILESAKIDGAGTARIVWDIILPLIRRSTMFVFVSNTVSNLLMFVPMYMITMGGPEMSTNLMMYEAYKSGFIYADFGRSYAIVTLLLLIAFVVVMAEMRLLKPKH